MFHWADAPSETLNEKYPLHMYPLLTNQHKNADVSFFDFRFHIPEIIGCSVQNWHPFLGGGNYGTAQILNLNYDTVHMLHLTNVTAHIKDLKHVTAHILNLNYITAHILLLNYSTAYILHLTYITVYIFGLNYITAHMLDLNYITVHRFALNLQLCSTSMRSLYPSSHYP